MKLLHFCLLAPGSPQHGLRAALKRIATGGYDELDWWWSWSNGKLGDVRQKFLDGVRSFVPDVIFAQIQTEGVLPNGILDQIRAFGPMIIEWCGDCRDVTPGHYFNRAPHVDLTCFSNMRDVEALKAKGLRSEFMNIGFSTDVFCPDGETRPTPEIVFLGNNYGQRFPRSYQRQMMIKFLRERYGSRFAVHGNGWGPDNPWVDEPTEAAIYRGCKIAINQNHYDSVKRFSSDRIFRLMGSGAFCISNYWPGMEDDFRIGPHHPPVHCATWRTFDELGQKIDYYLEHDDERKVVAKAGCEHVHLQHTWDSRMVQILGFVEQYRRKAA